MYFILLGIVVVIAILAVLTYNNLATKKNDSKNAFSQIEVQLQRRYDLIPNMVEIAKKYLEHEKETLTAVIAQRNNASNALKTASSNPSAENIQHLAQMENELKRGMAGFSIQVEAYPELKANVNMMQLSEELATTENRISSARQFYNDITTSYNTYRVIFPSILFAGFFGHREDIKLLEFDTKAINETPKIKF